MLTGRFAPSPTGPLHLGSLRTALAAWLFARAAGGRFLLRIEDLDPDRSRSTWEAIQLRALAELGIDWDGAVPRQSERLGAYAEALGRLEAAGHVYPCFCTRAEIRAAASAPHGAPGAAPMSPVGLPEGAYSGTCRRLAPAERAQRLDAGERHALRFDASAAAPVRFVDRLAGPQHFQVDDFVLRRADGVFAYQLAVVVDDAAQGVTQVIRGADLLDSVGRQTLLAAALGDPTPEWGHIPLVLGPDGRRLAKRHGAETGARSASATLLWLTRSLGITPDRPPQRAADLLAGFDPERIPTDPVAAEHDPDVSAPDRRRK